MNSAQRGSLESRGSTVLQAISVSGLSPTLFGGPYQYLSEPPGRELPAPSALQQGLGVLLRYWKLIACCIVIALLAALVVLVLVEPVFEADALVQIDLKDKSLSKSLSDEMSGIAGAPTPVTAEIELLKSRMVLGTVIDELGLDVVTQPHFLPIVGERLSDWIPITHPLRQLIDAQGGYAWGGERLEIGAIILPPGLLGRPLTVRIVGEGEYEVFDDRVPLVRGRLGQSTRAETLQGDLVMTVSALDGRVGTRFDLTVWSRADAVRELLEGYRATEQGKDSGLIRVSLRGQDPQRIASIVNIAIREYQSQDVSWRTAKAARTQEFLASQLPALKEKVEAAEGALTRYKFLHQAPDLTVETGLVLQQSVALEQTILQLRQQREELAQRFTDRHPTLMAVDAQLAQARDTQKRIAGRIRTMPASQRELATLTRDLEVNMRLYVAMLDEAQQLGVAKSGTLGVVRIVDAAVVPSLPMFPRPAILLASAFIAGLVGGGFLAAFLKATRDRIESATDLERAAVPRCLAAVRHSRQQRALQRGAKWRPPDGRPTLLAQAFPADPAMDGLRRLRAAVLSDAATREGSIILVAGMTPGVGRTFILANLSVMLVGAMQRTVLVDVDLEQRSLLRHFPSTGAGVSEWLLGQVENLDDVIQVAAPGQPDLVPAGLQTESLRGSLTPNRLRSLLNDLRARYDYVLVNAPPLSKFPDGILVAAPADAVILVARQFRHSARDVARLDERLARAGVNLIGTVLNDVQISDRLGYLGRSALA